VCGFCFLGVGKILYCLCFVLMLSSLFYCIHFLSSLLFSMRVVGGYFLGDVFIFKFLC